MPAASRQVYIFNILLPIFYSYQWINAPCVRLIHWYFFTFLRSLSSLSPQFPIHNTFGRTLFTNVT